MLYCRGPVVSLLLDHSTEAASCINPSALPCHFKRTWTQIQRDSSTRWAMFFCIIDFHPLLEVLECLCAFHRLWKDTSPSVTLALLPIFLSGKFFGKVEVEGVESQTANAVCACPRKGKTQQAERLALSGRLFIGQQEVVYRISSQAINFNGCKSVFKWCCEIFCGSTTLLVLCLQFSYAGLLSQRKLKSRPSHLNWT